MADKTGARFECIGSPIILLAHDNIDTDQIIPARFLTTTERDGLGEKLFYDWRYHEDGALRNDCVLNGPDARQAQVLVAGGNFGCGSSREHATWALRDFGFRAVLGTDFADIFRANALKNGLLPVTINSDLYDWFLANPATRITIDLEREELRYGDMGMSRFEIEPLARHCLLEGIDELDLLLAQEEAISAYEAKER
jgi:3-isopropylmalate/(R)-2-methylmalate dehydratase small subunit